MPDEVDALDPGSAVGHASAAEERVDAAAARGDGVVDGRLFCEIERDRLHPSEGDLEFVHHHDFGAQVENRLGDCCTHSGCATHDQSALAAVVEFIEL